MGCFTIGQLQGEAKVQISKNSPNQHIALFGISGSGKSVRINEIIGNIVRGGGTIIAFDLNGQDFKNNVNSINRISAVKDGIGIRFLDITETDLVSERYVTFVSYVTDMLSNTLGMGVRQMGVLREAVEFAIEHQSEYDSEMAAIAAGLELQSTPLAKGVYNKLWSVIKSAVFRKSEKNFQCGKINVLSFEGINPSAQKQLVEIVLAAIWRKSRLSGAGKKDVFIVLDEFQNLSLKKSSVLLEMLCEARKYNVNMILSTQSTAIFSREILAAINQTAIQMYFRPNISDVKKLAEIIESGNAEHWAIILKKLRVGQSVVTGNVSIQGKEIEKPIIINSDFTEANTKENRDSNILLDL